MADERSSSLRLRKDNAMEKQEKKMVKNLTEEELNADEAAAINGEAEQESPELPPFQIITGDRIEPFFFKFQFKNVEYSSGRNKTFLCYLVNEVRGGGDDAILRGFVEDEHGAGDHAEDAFFNLILKNYQRSFSYNVTWYVSSSPCPVCAQMLAQLLRERKNLRLTIFSARLFQWEEPEVRAGLKVLSEAGCRLRVMKPLDFSYTWETFVEHDGLSFEPWDECVENYQYYQEKLSQILE